MRRVAEWLAASFWNSALAAAASIAIVPPLASAVVVFRTLVGGPRQGMATAVFAMSALVGIQALSASMSGTLDPAATETRRLVLLMPVLAVGCGLLLSTTRSLKLVVQLTVLAGAVLVGALIFMSVPLEVYFKSVLDSLETLGILDFPEPSETLSAASVLLAKRSLLALCAVSGVWIALMLSMVLGNALSGLLSRDFAAGEFRDLSYGRVIAGLLAVLCLAASFSVSAVWVAAAMFVLVTFAVAGLAFAHWFAARQGNPVWVWVAYIALLPGLNVVGGIVLAVLGYFDAWFDLRRRMAKPVGKDF